MVVRGNDRENGRHTVTHFFSIAVEEKTKLWRTNISRFVIKNGQKAFPGVCMMMNSTTFVSDIPELGTLSLNCDLPLGSWLTASLPNSSPGILFAPADDGEDEEGWDEDEDDDEEDEDWEDEDDDEEDEDYDEDEDDEDEDWEDEEDEDESDSDEEDQ
jgi:hypothetical protein